jgi:hypothetical protein
MNLLGKVANGAYTMVFAALSNPDLTPLPKVVPDGNTFKTLVNIFFGILGAICLLIVTIQGLKIVLSRGSPQDIAKARNAIVYALIGLGISASAVTIANFVLRNVA